MGCFCELDHTLGFDIETKANINSLFLFNIHYLQDSFVPASDDTCRSVQPEFPVSFTMYNTERTYICFISRC